MEYRQYYASNHENMPNAVNTFGSIKGVVKKLGINHKATIYLLNPVNMNIIKTESDELGNYSFRGLAQGQAYLVFAKDINNQLNAVIQDNVVPK